MTYGTLKKRVMQLIFSYSVAGSEIPDTYNNQADYLAMIPSLVNDVEMDVATTVRRLPPSRSSAVLRITAWVARNNIFFPLIAGI